MSGLGVVRRMAVITVLFSLVSGAEAATLSVRGGVIAKPVAAAKSAAGWESTPFWTVVDPRGKAKSRGAELVFTGGQSALSLPWGSPGKTNMIEFFLGRTSVARFLGADLVGFSKDIVKGPGQGAALLTFAGFTFDAVRFTARAKGGSFELSNLRAAAVSTVPLPAGGVLLLAGLGGLAALRRRKAAAG